MADDQIQVLILLPLLLGIPAGDSLLIQGVENGDSGALRHAGESCNIRQLIDNDRIDNIGGNSDLIPDLSCDRPSQIGGVLPLYADLEIRQQRIRHGVGPSRNGL